MIVAADGPGFLVNRCGRPFYGEALRLLQERVATHEQIDRICRLGGGFRMGPFELMDLVGIDVGFEVAKSFDRAVLRRAALAAEPDPGADGRRRPARPQERARLLRLRGGRRLPAGRPRAARPGGGDGTRSPSSATARWPTRSASARAAAGYELREGGPAELVVDAGSRPTAAPGGAPLLVLCAATSLAARGEPGAVGFHLLPPLDDASWSS